MGPLVYGNSVKVPVKEMEAGNCMENIQYGLLVCGENFFFFIGILIIFTVSAGAL